MDVNPETVVKSPFFVGLLGAIVALRGTPGASVKERVFNLFSGTLLAGYLSPAIVEYFNLASPDMQAATAFVVGLFGLNLTAAIVEHIRGMGLSAYVPGKRKE